MADPFMMGGSVRGIQCRGRLMYPSLGYFVVLEPVGGIWTFELWGYVMGVDILYASFNQSLVKSKSIEAKMLLHRSRSLGREGTSIYFQSSPFSWNM